jgi:hypothetical protein
VETIVTLDGSPCSDPDGDALIYEWYTDYGGLNEAFLSSRATFSFKLALGVHTITLPVKDTSVPKCLCALKASRVSVPFEMKIGVSVGWVVDKIRKVAGVVRARDAGTVANETKERLGRSSCTNRSR